MRDYPVDRLADLIIHELLHATVFLKGYVQFNEELAEFVGSEGARLYVEERFGPESEEYRRMQNVEADSAVYIAFIQKLIAELNSLYKSGKPQGDILQEKDEIIKAAQERFAVEYETLFRSDNYRGFSNLQINNAYLGLYSLYYDGKSFFRDLYEKSGRDLPLFIEAVKTLKAKDDPRKQLEEAVLGRF
jgi:predicted aminopeptidase